VTVVESTLTTPFEYAEELLELCAAAIADTDGGPIDLQYVEWGRPAYDCEELVVSGMGFGEADTRTDTSLGAGKRTVHGRVNLVSFTVTVVRCAAVMDDNGNSPTKEQTEAKSAEMFAAVWAIWTRVYRAKRDGDLFEGKCMDLFFDGASSVDASGGLYGAEIRFRAEIAGIIASGS
jgi:hypothetical protein